MHFQGLPQAIVVCALMGGGGPAKVAAGPTRTVLVVGLVATILPHPLHLRTEKRKPHVLDRVLLNHVVLVWYG